MNESNRIYVNIFHTKFYYLMKIKLLSGFMRLYRVDRRKLFIYLFSLACNWKQKCEYLRNLLLRGILDICFIIYLLHLARQMGKSDTSCERAYDYFSSDYTFQIHFNNLPILTFTSDKHWSPSFVRNVLIVHNCNLFIIGYRWKIRIDFSCEQSTLCLVSMFVM